MFGIGVVCNVVFVCGEVSYLTSFCMYLGYPIQIQDNNKICVFYLAIGDAKAGGPNTSLFLCLVFVILKNVGWSGRRCCACLWVIVFTDIYREFIVVDYTLVVFTFVAKQACFRCKC